MSAEPVTLPPRFDKLGANQIDALCNVAFGGKGAGIKRRTLTSLAARGLIRPVENGSSDRFGTFTWTTYEMPIHVHVAFCEWCSAVRTDSAGGAS